MPFILDRFDNSVRGVSQVVYDMLIQQETRFAPAPEKAPEPTVEHEMALSSASDLVGTGKATTDGFVDVPVYGTRGDGTDTPTDFIRERVAPVAAPQPEAQATPAEAPIEPTPEQRALET